MVYKDGAYHAERSPKRIRAKGDPPIPITIGPAFEVLTPDRRDTIVLAGVHEMGNGAAPNLSLRSVIQVDRAAGGDGAEHLGFCVLRRRNFG